MIELNDKTQQDFLNREWVQKLLDAGVDMSDAKYGIIKSMFKDGPDSIILIKHAESNWNWIPTYTVSELLYKLHEWVSLEIDGKKYTGMLNFIKDAPFYIFYYKLVSKNYDPRKFPHDQPDEWDESLMGEFEYPIESLASLLIQCHAKSIGDTGNISDK